MRLEAEDRSSGKPLRNRPERSAHLVAIARPGAAVLAATASWVGERINVYPEFPYTDTVNPAYGTLDLAASFALRPWIEPYARVENALDRRYQPVLGFPSSGRTVIAGARLAW
jgi:outer membrane cobalamin receptor